MGVVWIAVLIMAVTALAAPAVKYDQRQEGDVNIRADLENFVILIIPTSNTGTTGLLDLLSKSLPGKGLLKHRHTGENKRPAAAASGVIPTQDPAQHFIESKTAPYHVDISRTRSHLAKLHPQVGNSEVLIAHSPTVALAKARDNSVLKSDSAFDEPEAAPRSRSARTLSIQPTEDFQALVLSSDLFVGRKFGRDKKVDNSEVRSSGENLTLLGAEMDQCGPDQKRDAQGICQLIKQ